MKFPGVKKWLCAGAFVGALGIQSVNAQTSIVNGSFEDPPLGSPTEVFGAVPFQAKVYDQEDIPGWSTTDPTNQIEIWDSGFKGVVSPDGNFHAEVNAFNTSTLSQTIDTFPGELLSLTVAHRGREGVDTLEIRLIDEVTDEVLFSEQVMTGNSGWIFYDFVDISAAGNRTRVELESISAVGVTGVGNLVDAILLMPNGGVNPDLFKASAVDACGLTTYREVARINADRIAGLVHARTKASRYESRRPSGERDGDANGFAMAYGDGHWRSDETDHIEGHGGGVLAGLERWFDNRTLFGVFFDYGRHWASRNGSTCRLDLDRYGAGLFAFHRLTDAISMSGIVGGNYSDLATSRMNGALTSATNGDARASQFFVDTRLSWTFAYDNKVVEPFVGFNYARNKVNAYIDGSGGIWDVAVDDSLFSTGIVAAGVSVVSEHNFEESLLRTSVHLSGHHVVHETGENIDQTLINFGTNGVAFTSPYVELDEYSGRLQLNVDFWPLRDGDVRLHLAATGIAGSEGTFGASGSVGISINLN